VPNPGLVIENPLTGETIRFLRTFAEPSGHALRERTVRPGFPHESRPHAHATLVERFEVLEGSAAYRLGGEERSLNAGERIELPPNIPHLHPWNTGSGILRLRQEVQLDGGDREGASAVEDYLVTTFGLAREGRTAADGRPPLLQVAVSLRAAYPHVYLAGIPRPIQRALILLLAPIGRLAGFRSRYPRFEAGA
jgi:mannose-6-phosphate isomerase-like protein (cupin superfamily)